MIRTLIVDDEAPARARLRHLLAASTDLEIVGEAEDGEQAIARVLEHSPQLVFLDIQMPGCTGMDVAASLPSPRPHVIFCTAFDQYAVDAFDLNAVDYLLKPVNRERLEKALDKVRTGRPAERPLALAARALPPRRFVARRGRTYHVIAAREVVAFVSEDGLTKLLTAADHSWVPPTLNDLEVRLDPRHFYRISRRAIVNLDAVQEILPFGDGQGEVIVTGGRRLEVSRRRFQRLTERLQN
jgi:two-component system LytT family response regulator